MAEIPKDTSGGASDSEVSEVAVKPAGPRPPSTVTTTTPAGWLRNTCLNRSGAIPGAVCGISVTVTLSPREG